MKILILLCALAVVPTAHAQPRPNPAFEFIPMRRTQIGDTAEPLALREIEPSYFWIYVKWPEKAKRKIFNGKDADATKGIEMESKMIQPEYIEPLYSANEPNRLRNKAIYLKGLQDLLAGDKTFRITVTSLPYSLPGQQRCVSPSAPRSKTPCNFRWFVPVARSCAAVTPHHWSKPLLGVAVHSISRFLPCSIRHRQWKHSESRSWIAFWPHKKRLAGNNSASGASQRPNKARIPIPCCRGVLK